MSSTLVIGHNIAGPCPHKPVLEQCATCILDTSEYFSGLSLAAKQAMQTSLELASLKRRELLYAENSLSENLYILVSGQVKVYKSLVNGRQQIYKLVQFPGDLIACEDLYLDRHSSTAEAIGPVTVCYLPQVDLHRCADRFGEISTTLMRSMARDLNAYVRHIANVGQKSAVERVASYLLFLRATHRQLNLPCQVLQGSLTRNELADMIGITQRTLIRGLKRLERDGIISLRRDGFVILDHDGLERVSVKE